jgi:hypothetical protein
MSDAILVRTEIPLNLEPARASPFVGGWEHTSTVALRPKRVIRRGNIGNVRTRGFPLSFG